MSEWQKLNEYDLLKKSHLPVLLIFNMVSEGRVLSVIEALSKGKGFGEEYGACTLPDDLDEFDKANGEELNGAEFALYNGEEVIIDFQTLYYYLKIICDRYANANNEQADTINSYLNDFIKRFSIVKYSNEGKIDDC